MPIMTGSFKFSSTLRKTASNLRKTVTFGRGMEGYKETIIEIEDTGIGIPKEDIEHIWERFYKADISRTNTAYGEYGLGLSIVKRLVEMHQGTVEIQSEEGKGTKFIIRLPLTAKQQ